jgi:hypothetical protein
VIIVAFVLLFTGKYHKDIFKLIMGINRWSFRVAIYVGLMTDEYPISACGSNDGMLLRPNIDVVDPHSEIPLYQSAAAVSPRPIGGNRKNRGHSPCSLFLRRWVWVC